MAGHNNLDHLVTRTYIKRNLNEEMLPFVQKYYKKILIDHIRVMKY